MDAKFYGGIFEGDNVTGMRLCMGITGGDFWARRSGCTAVYRGDMHHIDYGKIVCTAMQDSEQVMLPNWIEHNTSGCVYGVREIDGHGQEIQSTGNTVYISFDEHGRAVESVPPGILKIRARVMRGRVNLEWWYEPAAGQPAVKQFLIFSDHGTGCIDHTAAIGTVMYIGKRPYTWMSEVLAAGNYWFEIQAIRADKVAVTKVNVCVAVRAEAESPLPKLLDVSQI